MILLVWISYSRCSLLSNKELTEVNGQHYFGLNYIIFSCELCEMRLGNLSPEFPMSS